jgi:hypothetical protein
MPLLLRASQVERTNLRLLLRAAARSACAAADLEGSSCAAALSLLLSALPLSSPVLAGSSLLSVSVLAPDHA